MNSPSSMCDRLGELCESKHSGPCSPSATRVIYRRGIRPRLLPETKLIVDICSGSRQLERCLLADGHNATDLYFTPKQVAVAYVGDLPQMSRGRCCEMVGKHPGESAVASATKRPRHLLLKFALAVGTDSVRGHVAAAQTTVAAHR